MSWVWGRSGMPSLNISFPAQCYQTQARYMLFIPGFTGGWRAAHLRDRDGEAGGT